MEDYPEFRLVQIIILISLIPPEVPVALPVQSARFVQISQINPNPLEGPEVPEVPEVLSPPVVQASQMSPILLEVPAVPEVLRVPVVLLVQSRH